MLEFGSHSRNDLGTGIEKGLGINRFVDRSRACDGKKKGRRIELHCKQEDMRVGW